MAWEERWSDRLDPAAHGLYADGMQNDCFRRLVYVSNAATTSPKEDWVPILRASKLNNGIDGISGILWNSGTRYLQLLEGPHDSVGATYDRIVRDDRHRDVTLVSDTTEPERVFGDWSMAGLPGEHPEDALPKLRRLLRECPPEVEAMFDGAAASD